MIDAHLPTTDGREIVMARHTQREQDLQLLLDQLKLELPRARPAEDPGIEMTDGTRREMIGSVV